jgi:hypothetical protein
MALLVPNIGELESLRYLVNQTGQTPKNLVLKLISHTNVSAPTFAPQESDTPKLIIASGYTEPYTYAVGTGTDALDPYGYDYYQAINTAGAVIPAVASGVAGNRKYGYLLPGAQWTATISGDTNGTTTASFPEQTFTFEAGTTYIHGYFVARANTIQQKYLNNPTNTNISAAATTVTRTTAAATSTENVQGSTRLKVTAAVGNIAPGMVVTVTSGQTGAITGTVTVVGVDNAIISAAAGLSAAYIVTLSSPLTTSLTPAGGDTITFSFSQITATNHGGAVGDVVWIGRGTGNTTTTEGNYTIYEVPDANTIRTWPALDGTGTCGIYDSIMFSESFTNGPYKIQNNGDQIKITLNVSLN